MILRVHLHLVVKSNSTTIDRSGECVYSNDIGDKSYFVQEDTTRDSKRWHCSLDNG